MYDVMNEDKTVIYLPVPMESLVYTPMYRCNDACSHYGQQFREAFPDARCTWECPGHIKVHGVKHALLTYQNLGKVLEGWMTRYFPTKGQAREFAEKVVQEHKELMEQHGIPVSRKMETD